MLRALPLLAAIALIAGCAPSRIAFDPTPTRAEVPVGDVEAGEALYPFAASGAWGYMDATGRVVIEPAFQSAERFSEGRAAVRLRGRYGYVDPSGAVVVPAQYVSAAPFAEGRALVAEGTVERPRYGFVDPLGAVVVPTILPMAYSYSGGRALVRFRERDLTWVERVFEGLQGESLGFIDREGEVAFYVPGDAASFSEGLAPFSRPVLLARSRWGYLRPDGTVAVPATFRGAAFRHTEGLARVAEGLGVGFVDADGAPAFDRTFALAQAFSEGLAAVEVDGFWGYIDASGAVVIAPQFRQAGPFSEGLAAVEQDGRWGYVGPDGQFVIEPVYRSAQAFHGPLALVVTEGAPHYIDRAGRPVLPALSSR